MNDDEAIRALISEFDRDPALPRRASDEIWVRARVDEIQESDRPALRLVPVLALDATAAVLAWSLLPEPLTLLGLGLSKALAVALAASVTHAAQSFFILARSA